jgi:hypothetical protein
MSMNTPITTGETLVRFQCFVTKDQHSYLKWLASEKGIPGAYAIRKGLVLYANRRGDKIASK